MLAVTAVADTFANARARAYRAVDQIDFADGFHRRDIGWRELEREQCMNALWNYFWPSFAAGLVIGALAGTIALPAPQAAGSVAALAIGAALSAASLRGVLWHGPLGAADRLDGAVERDARPTLDHYEMTQVSAHLHRASAHAADLILSGPADDFQRSELVRHHGRSCRASASARWSTNGGGVPLIVEGAGAGARWAFSSGCCSPIWSSFAVGTTHNGIGEQNGSDPRILVADPVGRRSRWSLAFILLRPRQRVTLTDSAPPRPHMAQCGRRAKAAGSPAKPRRRPATSPARSSARRSTASSTAAAIRPTILPAERRRPEVRGRAQRARLLPLRADRAA